MLATDQQHLFARRFFAVVHIHGTDWSACAGRAEDELCDTGLAGVPFEQPVKKIRSKNFLRRHEKLRSVQYQRDIDVLHVVGNCGDGINRKRLPIISVRADLRTITMAAGLIVELDLHDRGSRRVILT